MLLQLIIKYKWVIFYTLVLNFNIFNTLCAQTCFQFELFGGVVYNIPAPLTVYQKGEPTIRLIAKYETEPFISPYYWSWRVNAAKEKYHIGFEAIHQKIYLINKPDEIQRFGISHGLNLLNINYSRNLKYFDLLSGLGTILAHPENTIREKALPERGRGFLNIGYYLTGNTANVGISKRIRLNKYFYSKFEIRFIPAYAVVPVIDGNAKVFNPAIHGNFGLGFQTRKLGKKVKNI